jgi:aerobic carbon-monoxide dehydrogenase medium subunit
MMQSAARHIGRAIRAQAEASSVVASPVVKPAAVDYVRPRSLAEAIGLLAEARNEARVVAGGQSLVAMMNLRLAAPDLLIDIARLPELAVAVADGDGVTLGACVTHAMIEDGAVPDPTSGLMPRIAAGLAYRAIRSRGTIGGSLALADPAAEWPAVLAALDAEAVLHGPNGRRAIKCAEFATGIFETRLGRGEIVESIRIPKLSAAARCGYLKLCRKAGEFAQALAVAVSDPRRGFCRVVIGAANGAPLMLAAASASLAAGDLEGDSVRRAIAADLDHAADRHFDDFQRNLHAVAAWRAIRQLAA